MGQNVQTYYGITIKHVWEHGKYWASKARGNWKESLNWKHDAESTFLSHDLGQIAKNIFNKQKAKTQWSQAVRKRLFFAILLNVSLKQTRSVAMRWNPKTPVQFSKSRVPIKGPMHSQIESNLIDLQESQNVYFRVKLRAKKCRKLLSSNWNLKHHYLWARAQEMPKMSLVIYRWIQTFKWVLHGSRKRMFRPT